ncbi:MAG TPA: BtpA/SgcQ family protein [Thermoanaerobaculia bacterium]
MLTREAFVVRFGAHAVFGMVHLKALPGAPLFGGSMDEVIDAALGDARAIAAGGCDGLAVENFGDRPFYATRVPAETIAAMTRVIAAVAGEVRLPIGVNVLRNDARAALAIAAAVGAAFIRINVHTGAMLTDQGIIEGDAAGTLRLRARLAPDVLIFADHLVKHAVPLAPVDVVGSARDLRLRGCADAIIVTGPETGAAADPDRLHILREALDAPLIIGSGLDESNAASFADADGAIVGTALKRGGDVEAEVDQSRVERIVRAFKSRGGR